LTRQEKTSCITSQIIISTITFEERLENT